MLELHYILPDVDKARFELMHIFILSSGSLIVSLMTCLAAILILQ